MTKFLTFLIPFLLLGCSHKEFIKKENFIIKENDSFILINPFVDPLNLANDFINILEEKKFKVNLAHKNILNKGNETSQGSGFFIDAKGTIVTNNHVTKREKYFEITTDDKKIFLAEVIFIDEKNDIAILKPVKEFYTKYWFKLSNKKIVLGKKINVLGYPLMDILGTEIRITQGIISSKKGIKNDKTQFQISAAIQPGNSGGPIIDRNITLIGIATARLSDKYLLNYLSVIPQNINFGVKSIYITALLKKYKHQVSSSNSKIYSLEDAAMATVLVTTPKKNLSILKNNTLINALKIKYKYTYDVAFDTISYLEISILTKTNKEIIKGTYEGDSLSGPRDIAKELLVDVLNKATIK